MSLTNKIKDKLLKILVETNSSFTLKQLLPNLFCDDAKITLTITPDGRSIEEAKELQIVIEKRLKAEFPEHRVIIGILDKKLAAKPQNAKEKLNCKIILVASCKGGVGKSTTTLHLALAAAKNNYKVGIVDADIFGPSIPDLMGLKEEPVIKNNKFIPLEKSGIKVMSMGLLFPPEKAAIWRGPMVTKALKQLISQTDWGDLDLLFIDMPPGTGDVYLSMMENFYIDGSIIVSTPQELSVNETQRTVYMFKKCGIPIYGVIENMSYFLDPISKNKTYIFGNGAVKEFAKRNELKLLGEIPLVANIAEIEGLFEKSFKLLNSAL